MPAQPDLRRKILETSRAAGRELGTEGITMRGIASTLRISATSIYHHFENKGAIIDALRLGALCEFMAVLTAGLGELQGRDALIACGRRYVSFGREDPWSYSLLLENETLASADFDAEQREQFRTVQRDFVTSLRSRLEPSPLTPTAQARALASWWSWLHGATALILSNRIRQDQDVVPVDDVELFIAETVADTADAFLRRYLGG